MNPRATAAIAVAGIALAGCGASRTYGTAHAPVSVPSPAHDVSPFPGHTCTVSDKLDAEALAVTPTKSKCNAEAKNVCEQLFGAPKAHASGIPAGYVLHCTGFGYGLVTRIYARPGAKDDCTELAKAGYSVSGS